MRFIWFYVCFFLIYLDQIDLANPFAALALYAIVKWHCVSQMHFNRVDIIWRFE